MVVGSTCSLVWERRTTCWVTMRVPDPNIPIVRRPLPVREGRDLDHHVTACSEGAGVRGHAGGGGAVLGLLSAPFLLGGGGAAKGLLPCFLVPKGDQPTACTLALWWLKSGPTRSGGGGGVATLLECFTAILTRCVQSAACMHATVILEADNYPRYPSSCEKSGIVRTT